MRETPNLSLKLPDLTDYVNVEDFNENFTTLDAKVTQLNNSLEEIFNGTQIVVGEYTGDGTTNRTINIGIRPKIVFLSENSNSSYSEFAILANRTDSGLSFYATSTSAGSFGRRTEIIVTDGGFRVSATIFNGSAKTFSYVAIC